MGNNIHNRLITRSWVCHIIVSLILCAILCISGFAAIAEESDTANPFTYVKASVDGYGSFYYRHAMLLRDSRSLSTDLVKASAVIAAAAYNAGKVRDVLEDMGFSSFDDKGSYALVDSMPLTNCDYVAFHIAKKIVNYEGQKYIIYCVPIKGTTGNYEWFSNMNIGENGSDDHEGFFRASTQVLSALEDELATTRSTYGASNTIIWLTGHSRGAAVANFVAGRLTRGYSYVPAENIFAYTYACPSVSKNVSEFNNIYNFNIRGDLIPILPLEEWGYGRFGHTIKLDSPSGVPSSTVGYEESLKLLFPNELAAHSLSGKLALGIIANVMIGEKKLGFIELLDYLGYTIDANDFAEFLVSYGNASFADLYNAVESKLNHYDELKREWYDYYTILDSMSEEEQEQWLLDNSGIVNELSKITGQPIPDVDAVWSSYVYLKHLVNADSQPHDIERTIKNVYDMLIDANTLNLKAMVTDGHKQASYTSSINTKYYGYYGCTGRTGDVEIPGDITSIGEGCFNNCTGLTSISGGSLELIGEYAFSGCTGLGENLELPEGLFFVGSFAFQNCENFETLIIPKTVLFLGESSFVGCIGLKEVTLPVELSKPDGVFRECRNVETIHYTKGSTGIMADSTTNRENIGRYTLEAYSLEHLTTIEFEEGITHIGAYAFDSRNANDIEVGVLSTVVIPSTLESIGDHSFYGQKNWVTTLELPEGIQSIGEASFAGCDGLHGNLILPEGLESLGRDCFNSCAGFEGLTIPNTLSVIPIGCFYNCFGIIGQVIIPESVEIIEGSSFYGCNGIETVVISNSVTQMGIGCFVNCDGIKEITLPIEFSDQYNFTGCSNVETIHYLKGRTGIMPDREWATMQNTMEFCSHTKLKSIDFGEGITHIGSYAFHKHNEGSTYSPGTGVLEEVNLPSTLKSIGESAFAGQPNIDMDLILPEGLQELGASCFAGCTSLKSLTIPSTISELQSGCFSNCSGIEGELNIPDTIEAIGSNCFYGCSGLTGKLSIPESIEKIESSCFYGCSGIEEVVILNSVTEIGGDCFVNCSGIKEITLPIEFSDQSNFIGCSSVETIHYLKGQTGVMMDRVWANGGLNYTMEYCSHTSLKKVDFEEGVTHIGRYAFHKHNEGSTYSPGTGVLEEVNLPSTLKSIGESAFAGQPNIDMDLILPEGLQELGASCFAGCTSLKSLTIPSTISELQSGCFSNCSGIEGELNIPDTIEAIGSNCFYGCSGLTGRLVIPDKICRIEDFSFYGCSGLETVTISNATTEIGQGCFINCSGIKEITLPIDFSDQYNFAGCSAVETIHYLKGQTGKMPDRDWTRKNNTIEYCSRACLKSIDFEEGITQIGTYAFYIPDYEGGALEEVELPSTLECLGEEAFRYQAHLAIDLVLPEGISKIGDSCFSGCGSLKSVTMPKHLSEIGSNAFDGCYRITMYGYLGSYSQAYAYVNSIPFVCLDVTKISPDFILPTALTIVDEEAFAGCIFTAVKVPTGCSNIGALAFSDCKNLAQIEIPASVTQIAEDAFKDSDSVIIFCPAGSVAETFAKEHGLSYVIE